MRMMSDFGGGGRVAVGAILVAAVICGGGVAQATTFDPITVEQLTERSEFVVRGHVVELRVHPEGPNGLPGIHTEVVLEVAEALKGAPDRVVRFWIHGGRIGNRVRVVHGQATFSRGEGEEVIMFLFRNDAGVLWPTGMGRGKWSVRQLVGSPSSPLHGGHGSPATGAPVPVDVIRRLVASAT